MREAHAGGSGWRRLPATIAYGVSGSASTTARHASSGSPSFAHSRARPRWSCTTASSGYSFASCSSRSSVPVRPGRERRADLRLERVVLREERSRSLGFSPLIESRTLASDPAPPRPPGTRSANESGGRPSRSSASVVVAGAPAESPSAERTATADDSDRRDRHGADEERDTTLRGHRRTIARSPTL